MILMIFRIFNVFINIHVNANYVDKIICICHKMIKGQCLSFHFVPILVGCDKKLVLFVCLVLNDASTLVGGIKLKMMNMEKLKIYKINKRNDDDEFV